MKAIPKEIDYYDSLPIGVFAVDTDMNIVHFNAYAAKVTGYSQTTALSCKCYEVFRSEQCFSKCPLRAVLGGGEAVLRGRNSILTKANIVIPVDIAVSVITDKSGNIKGAIECFQEPVLNVDVSQKSEKSPSPKTSLFGAIIGQDKNIAKIIEILSIASKTNANILITGETGTGKDIFASCIKGASPRLNGRFVKVNCAATPGELLESEFFGYKKGAFTDAKTDKPGRFQMAEGGTIFLDEIGDLPVSLQAKLLQVLDEKAFYPLGATKPLTVDVRIISSTNRNINEMIKKGTFREDLYYRLNSIHVVLPPLRKRRSDIPFLINHFFKENYRGNSDCNYLDLISPQAMKVLLDYDYPGNIRELKHIIEHACILSQGEKITLAMLPQCVFSLNAAPTIEGDDGATFSFLEPTEEKNQLLMALRKNSWNRKKTAEILKIDRTTVWRKMKRLGLLC